MRLITWNIQWGRGVDGRVDLARLASKVRSLGDFDVMCFQEVADNYAELGGNDDANQFAVLAAQFPGHAALEGVALDLGATGRAKRFGNLILSRYPVHSVRRHALPWPPDARFDSMPRMAIEAVVEAPFGPLRVTTTHLEYYSSVQRMAQATRLRELHAEACARALHGKQSNPEDSNATFKPTPQPARAILTGDFNFPPEAPEHPAIQQPLEGGAPRYVDAWKLVHGDRPHDPTFCLHDHSWKPAPYCCDFIFVSEGLRVAAIEVDAQAQESDHQPVMITID